MSTEIIQKKKKKLSQGLQELIDKANEYHDKASEIVKEAYAYAVNVDNMSPTDARVTLYKNLDYSPQWIRKYLPKVAKRKYDPVVRKLGKQEDSNINVDLKVVSNERLNTSPEDEDEVDEEETEEEQESNHKWNLANIAINKYFEALTGHFLADGEQFYTKEHVIQSKTFRSELVKSLKPHEATKIRKELIVLQYLTQEVLKLIEEGKISK
jgi:hypothetical protein